MFGNGNPFANPSSAAAWNPVQAVWNTVAHFGDYDSAQRAVDRLSDDGFPVEKLDVVGSNLRLVERVTGRLTKVRAASTGAVTGLWLGLLFGLLIGLFATGASFFVALVVGALLGAAWGALFGFVAHTATGGRRDFSSVRTIVASRYDLIAREGTADLARRMLGDAGLLPTESVPA